jgi:NAD(P)-dependent dehydrogenase (short-subunit alcohol dehydrogenase family)
MLAEAVALADPYGGLDVMVCNAGMNVPNDDMDLSEDRYDRLIDVNLKGVFRSARAAAKAMIARGRGGSIVIIASMGGVRGSVHTLTYSATKGAARLYAAAFADTLGPHGIRVNAVCPGIIDTGFTPPSPEFKTFLETMMARTPLRRCGQADEVANTVVWLGSDLSSFVTGASILVDGGLTAVL